MIDLSIGTDYSPMLRMWLEAEGTSWPIAKLGPEHFVPAESIDLCPCDGRIVMTVDGEEHSWQVKLVRGACPLDDAVPIRILP